MALRLPRSRGRNAAGSSSTSSWNDQRSFRFPAELYVAMRQLPGKVDQLLALPELQQPGQRPRAPRVLVPNDVLCQEVDRLLKVLLGHLQYTAAMVALLSWRRGTVGAAILRLMAAVVRRPAGARQAGPSEQREAGTFPQGLDVEIITEWACVGACSFLTLLSSMSSPPDFPIKLLRTDTLHAGARQLAAWVQHPMAARADRNEAMEVFEKVHVLLHSMGSYARQQQVMAQTAPPVPPPSNSVPPVPGAVLDPHAAEPAPAPAVAPFVVELVAALQGSQVMEHSAQLLMRLLQTAEDRHEVGITAGQFLKSYNCFADSVFGPPEPLPPAMVTLAEAASGPCADYVAMRLGLRTLCAADGGSAQYGMPHDVNQDGLVSGPAAATAIAALVAATLLSAKFERIRRRAPLVVLKRVCRLAVAAVSSGAAAAAAVAAGAAGAAAASGGGPAGEEDHPTLQPGDASGSGQLGPAAAEDTAAAAPATAAAGYTAAAAPAAAAARYTAAAAPAAVAAGDTAAVAGDTAAAAPAAVAAGHAAAAPPAVAAARDAAAAPPAAAVAPAPARVLLPPSESLQLAARCLVAIWGLLEPQPAAWAAVAADWWRWLLAVCGALEAADALGEKDRDPLLLQLGQLLVAPLLKIGAETPLPPVSPPALAAALAAGVLPVTERILRRAARNALAPERKVCLGALGADERGAWRLLEQLLVYGEPRQAAALVATVGKALHRMAAGPDFWVILPSMHWLTSFAAEALGRGLAALEHTARHSQTPDGVAAPIVVAPAAQMPYAALSYAVYTWLPPLSRILKHAAASGGGLRHAKLTSLCLVVLDWLVVLSAASTGSNGAEGPAGSVPSSSSSAAAAEAAAAATAVAAGAAPSSVGTAAGVETGAVRDAASGEATAAAPGPSSSSGGGDGGGSDAGGWRRLLLDEVDAVALLDAAIRAIVIGAELAASAVKTCVTLTAAFPNAVRPAVEVTSAQPWPPGLLRRLGRNLRADGGDEEAAVAAEVLGDLLTGWAAGSDSAAEPCLRSLQTTAAEIWAQQHSAPTARLLTPPAAARRLIPTCGNPRCTNLEGDSELDVILQGCAGCGAVGYCCRECQVAHWRAGHKRECKAMRRREG